MYPITLMLSECYTFMAMVFANVPYRIAKSFLTPPALEACEVASRSTTNDTKFLWKWEKKQIGL